MKRQWVVRLILSALVLGGSSFGQQVALASLPAAVSETDASGTANASISTAPHGETGFFNSWQDRVRVTLAQQPSWAIPLVTASSGLLQVFRTDFVRQITPAGTDTWIYGNTKGLNLVPWYKVEFDTLIPPYVRHNSSAKDGFGDFSMLLKYRLAAADATHGNYSVSVSLGSTLPTGSYKNGTLFSTISPTICAGKGFGRFDVQSTVGATLPVADTVKLGRVMAWNTAAQYHIGKLFWPEIEDNAFFYHGGPNDGRVQNFLTPGLILSRIQFQHDSRSLSSLCFGGGMQIATTHFHTYNHGLVLTARMLF
jgi:hypothetical protein